MPAIDLRFLYVFTDLLLPLIVGYYLHRYHLMNEQTVNKIIRINVIVVYTLLSLLSFWVLPLSLELIFAPIFGFLLVIIPGAIGYLLFARRIPNLLDRGAYLASAMLANLGTLGGVCAFILYNEQGFAYAQLIGTCQTILLCLLIFPMAQYYHQKHTAAIQKTSRWQTLRDMFLSPNQLCLLGMAAGLLLNGAGIPRPSLLAPVFQSFVHIGAWIAMFPVGFMIDFHKVREYAGKTHSLTLLRFVITPLSIAIISYPLISDSVFLGTLFILAATPTAINAVITTKLYQLTVDLAISSFVITTALFLLFIFPLLFFLLKAF